MPKQPTTFDFTCISDKFDLLILVPSGPEKIARFRTQEEADRAELAIHQIMIDYHTKRSRWEKELSS